MSWVCPHTTIHLGGGTSFEVSLGIDAFTRLWQRAMRRGELIEVQPRRLLVNPRQIVMAEGRR